MEELKEFKKELEEILEKVNKKLEEDKKYWTVSGSGEITNLSDYSDDFDRFNKETGNYFKTKEEAEEYLEDLKIKTEIKNIAKELNGDKKIDWNDEDQTKYYLTYSHVFSSVANSREYLHQQEGTTYCLHWNFMNICIERIGYERLENYLKRN